MRNRDAQTPAQHGGHSDTCAALLVCHIMPCGVAPGGRGQSNQKLSNALMCLLCLQVTDAGRIFVRLAGRVSEGEVGFGSEAVGMPATSIRQQAIR